MPCTKKGSPPSYRLYKRTNQVVITIDGEDHSLGEFGSLESKQKYQRLIRAWLDRQERPGVGVPAATRPRESEKFHPLGFDLLGLRQVAGILLIDVERLSVEDEPDPRLRLGIEGHTGVASTGVAPSRKVATSGDRHLGKTSDSALTMASAFASSSSPLRRAKLAVTGSLRFLPSW
jgi:hypothetical protein